jgi:Ni,Fe-hydrogenase III small subunit
MSQWVWKGLTTGVKTTEYPRAPEHAPGVTPGLPVSGAEYGSDDAAALVSRCPSGALSERNGRVVVDHRRCVHAYRCVRQTDTPLEWSDDYEWAAADPTSPEHRHLGGPFSRSAHIIVVDAGDCGACLNEVKQLNNPYYNMHRLGFFITPTPRHADILLVVGPVTDHMRVALHKTYDAMPTPKRVVAVGACALSGGVFGPSFVTEGGVKSLLPVDVEVPGQPPPPLAILHGLLVAVGRKPPGSLLQAHEPAVRPELTSVR